MQQSTNKTGVDKDSVQRKNYLHTKKLESDFMRFYAPIFYDWIIYNTFSVKTSPLYQNIELFTLFHQRIKNKERKDKIYNELTQVFEENSHTLMEYLDKRESICNQILSDPNNNEILYWFTSQWDLVLNWVILKDAPRPPILQIPLD